MTFVAIKSVLNTYCLRHCPLHFLAKSLVAFLLASILAIQPSLAKSTSDPNADGWNGKGKKFESVEWKPRTTKCVKCQKMVAQYNSTVKELFSVRFLIEAQNRSYRDALENLKSRVPQTNDLDSSRSGSAFGMFDDLNEAHEDYLNQLKHNRLVLEQQAHNLQLAIASCERQQCEIKKNKDKKIKIGGEDPTGNYQPNINDLFKKYGATWQTPSTDCPKCLPIVEQIDGVPSFLTKAEFEYQRAVERLKRIRANERFAQIASLAFDFRDRNDAYEQVKQADAKIKAIIRLYKELVAALATCEQKYCPKIGFLDPGEESEVAINCSATSPQDSIEIGANSDVGSRAKFKEKGKKKAAGLATKALTSLLGVGGGGGGGSSDKPTTYKDPIKKKNKTRVRNKEEGRDFYTGAQFIQGGLLVSSDLNKAPNKGTFHEIYIQNPRGWKLEPIGVYMYEIWRDWKLNVSWTRDTYIDGEHVKHEEGGWSESWSELIAKGEETIYGEVQQAPLWEQLGFNTAVSGARSVGTLFPVSTEMLTTEQHQLVVHVSVPKTDPVITYPYVFDINVGDDGTVTLDPTDESTVPDPTDCEEKDLFPGPTILPTTPPLPGDPEDDDWITAPDPNSPIPLDLPTMPPVCPNGWVCETGKLCPPIENCTSAEGIGESVDDGIDETPSDWTDSIQEEPEGVSEEPEYLENDTYSSEEHESKGYDELSVGDKPGVLVEDIEEYTEEGLTYGLETPEPDKVGIVLKSFDPNWLPEDKNSTLLYAKMYVPSATNPKLWVPDPNVKRIMEITFVARSNERGKAMNANLERFQEDAPDLYFKQSSQPLTLCRDDATGNGHFGTCTTKFEENQQMFVVNSEDFGGFSHLDVKCEGCVPLKPVTGTYPDGSGEGAQWEVAVEEQDQEKRAVYVPKDDNRNQIGDGWIGDKLYSPAANEDTDGTPVGNGKIGDGFSAYEEYRGFLDKSNVHHRTDLKTKNLFIWNLGQVKTALFKKASGLGVIEIEAWQHRDRIINFNSGHANLVDQHGVIIRLSSKLGDRVAGLCQCEMDRPKSALMVYIAPDSTDESTVAHELGHSVGMNHHGEVAWADNKESIRMMTSGLGDLLPGRVHSGPTLCGKTLPDFFWIGTKGDQGSGHESCIMRYGHTHFAYEQEGEDYDCMPYKVRNIFDTSAAGTGPNGFDRTAGDATVGDCMSQIWINSL